MPNVVELLEMYGVLIVFGVVLLAQGGLPVPAFPILVLSGASAVSGSVSWQACIGTAVLACLIGDYLWFSAGRFYGGRVLGLLCKISLSPDVCVSQTEEQFARFGAKSLLVAYSTANWTPIPRQTGHPFHGKLDSQSSANWTPIPLQTGQFEAV